MDYKTIEKEQLVDRYVRGSLSEEQMREFELFMFENPSILDEVEYARGMLTAAKQSDLSETDVGSVVGKPKSISAWFAVAASLLIATTLGLSFLGPKWEWGNSPGNGTELREYYFDLERTRSGTADTYRVLSVQEDERLVLIIEYPADLEGPLDAFIQRPESEERSSVRIGKVTENRFAHVGLPSGLSGMYLLILRNMENDKKRIIRFEIRK